jgi:hypothetical protein
MLRARRRGGSIDGCREARPRCGRRAGYLVDRRRCGRGLRERQRGRHRGPPRGGSPLVPVSARWDRVDSLRFGEAEIRLRAASRLLQASDDAAAKGDLERAEELRAAALDALEAAAPAFIRVARRAGTAELLAKAVADSRSAFERYESLKAAEGVLGACSIAPGAGTSPTGSSSRVSGPPTCSPARTGPGSATGSSRGSNHSTGPRAAGPERPRPRPPPPPAPTPA